MGSNDASGCLPGDIQLVRRGDDASGAERSASSCMSVKLSGEATRRSLRDRINLQPSRKMQLPRASLSASRSLEKGGK